MKSTPKRMTTEQMQATIGQLHQAMTGSVSAAAHTSAVTTSGCTCCGGAK